MQTEAELDVKELVDTLTYKQSEIKAKTLSYTLGHVHWKALLYTLVQTLAEVQVAKFKDTRCDVKGLAIVDVRVYMLAGKKAAPLVVMCRYYLRY